MIIELLIGLALVCVIAYLLRQNRQLQIELQTEASRLCNEWANDRKNLIEEAKSERSKRVTLEECQRLQAARIDDLQSRLDIYKNRVRLHEATLQDFVNSVALTHGIQGESNDSE